MECVLLVYLRGWHGIQDKDGLAERARPRVSSKISSVVILT